MRTSGLEPLRCAATPTRSSAASRAHAVDQRRFVAVGRGQQQRALVRFARDGERHRKCAANRADRAGERQLADEFEFVERIRRDLLARRKDADGDRQVEAARGLRQVGRREVDGETPVREVEAGVQQRCAHAIAALAHFGFGKTDDVEGRQSDADVDFDADRGRIEADEGATVDDGERHGDSRRRPVLEAGERRGWSCATPWRGQRASPAAAR